MDKRANSDAFGNLEVGKLVFDELKKGLSYRYHPVFDWRPLPIKKKTIEINRYGLRGPDFVLDDRPRVVVLGGSMIWGYGATAECFTPRALLQDYLKSHFNLDANVICLADQMYTSVQEQKSFVFSIDEIRPDLVICVSGVNDVAAGFRGEFKNHLKIQEFSDFFNWGIHTGIVGEKSQLKRVLKVLLRGKKVFHSDFETFNRPQNKQIPKELFNHKVSILNDICGARAIPIVYGWHPTCFAKKNPSPWERDYLNGMDKDYRKFFVETFSTLYSDSEISRSGVAQFFDPSDEFNSLVEPLFIDSVHVSDQGFRLYVDRLGKFLVESGMLSRFRGRMDGHRDNLELQ